MNTREGVRVAQLPSQSAEFRRMYEAHHPQVLAYFLRRLDRSRAYDSAADVFLTAWRRIDDVPGGDGTLPWLYGVAHKVLANQRRSIRRFARLAERASARIGSESPVTPEAVVVQSAEYEIVLGALARLGRTDREVIRLSVWEELPHDQIGAVLGCSAKAVGMRLHRALRRLEREAERGGYPRAQNHLVDPSTEGGTS